MIAFEDLNIDALAPGAVHRLNVGFAILPDGQQATFPLIVVSGQKDGPSAALTGGIHGDEYEGPSALWRLAETIGPEMLAGRLIIAPLINLAAFAAGTRTSPIDGQNLARIFPGDPAGTLSFRLAHCIFEAVVANADFLVDCHSGGVRLNFLDVAGFYDANSEIPLETALESLSLARDLGLSHIWRLPPRSGVLSYEALRRGIPATGGEIGGRGGLLQEEADGYFHGIRSVLAKRGMIEAPDLPPARDYATALDGDWELAPVGGFMDNHVEVGQRVSEGTLLATIRSPLGDVLVDLHAKTDGVVMGTRHLRSIAPGEWATCVVKETPL